MLPVWARGISGKGVVVAVLDDGLDHTNPDLKHNYVSIGCSYLQGTHGILYQHSKDTMESILISAFYLSALVGGFMLLDYFYLQKKLERFDNSSRFYWL